jgi:RNA polymerase sigma factor (TIGR02999 family)
MNRIFEIMRRRCKEILFMLETVNQTDSITQLLAAHGSGDRKALEKLLPLVYHELKRLAESHLRRERPEHTLQPTALVHEAYLRLIKQEVSWQNRAHFFGIAGRVMRQILVDYARERSAGKRGSGGIKLSLNETIYLTDERAAILIALDDALEELARFDSEKARLVELRYFAGLSVEETAQAMGISVPTVVRHWRSAKAWLMGRINS